MGKAISTTVGFMPAVTFFGYPDGVTKVEYPEGRECFVSPGYLALLKAKGLVADPVAKVTDSTD